ncbi:hypothetical protein BHF71_10075 [Vulcanibacillus modesticaldus]|uniref:Type II secretion system protein GspF domain-containing protein n=1 Tax=Vulcanibacillus modesticaldus TaxID=337097 RepID=A0A1D2YU14_9BACI|nr:type II secretion system F family protein [Vulcanibacillus modesticaldus]OEF99141.1 hypothetical protein BHF71_10075 [Vulcanibacillus modesticaldus]
MILMISLLSGGLFYIIYSLLVNVWIGNQGEKGHLKKYYAYIKGEENRKHSLLERILKIDHDQRQYAFDTKKYLSYAVPISLGIFLFVVFFFRSWSFALVISLTGIFYPRFILKGLIEKRRKLLNYQLKEAMFSLSSSLRAGASLQKAIERSVSDLQRIYQNDKEAPILIEFRRMAEELKMGYSVEETLISFRDRVQIEDVDDFVNATLIAKTRGGNLTEILNNISKMISEKIEIKNEIEVMTSGKRMEASILSLMPIGIVGSLTLLSPEYMEPMYSTLIGKLLMFIGFILIAINYYVSKKIVDIEV